MSSMKDPCRLEKTSYSRLRSLPMQVSTMIRRPCEITRKAWKFIRIRPSGVMKCGFSQSYDRVSSGVASFSSTQMSS